MRTRPEIIILDQFGTMWSKRTSVLSAAGIVDAHFKGQIVDSEPLVPTDGVMPRGAFIVCGECSDEGGGSSGQCK